MKTALHFGGRFAAVSALGLWLMIAGIWTLFSRDRKASKETDRLKAELAQLGASQTPQLSTAPQGN